VFLLLTVLRLTPLLALPGEGPQAASDDVDATRATPRARASAWRMSGGSAPRRSKAEIHRWS